MRMLFNKVVVTLVYITVNHNSDPPSSCLSYLLYYLVSTDYVKYFHSQNCSRCIQLWLDVTCRMSLLTLIICVLLVIYSCGLLTVLINQWLIDWLVTPDSTQSEARLAAYRQHGKTLVGAHRWRRRKRTRSSSTGLPAYWLQYLFTPESVVEHQYYEFPSVLWYCWLGDRNGIGCVKTCYSYLKRISEIWWPGQT